MIHNILHLLNISLVVFIDTQFDDVNAPSSCTSVFFSLCALSAHRDDFKFHNMMWMLALQQRFQFEVWLLCERLSVAVLHPYTAAEAIPSLGDMVIVKHRWLTVAKNKTKDKVTTLLWESRAPVHHKKINFFSCCSFSTEHGRLFWLMQALIIDSPHFIFCFLALPMVHKMNLQICST